ncbi:hypothetical protein APS56_09950 [Pseudalgibacter alginicilyticus]|uniref:Uncharacterized protein n=1 Tax=Pseudalgibacter alginicilyticus TaxID=1736674 RepID=A0A0P0CH06_9FLAO|nr:DNRLRE domain-containing protein [Pseudalgibacter alginicilyticus]ALJ05421.1 hypothetical protein APS56_09950 [Pseudalgibacter alginicilyticus]
MKKTLLFLAVILFTASMNAQSFIASDDVYVQGSDENDKEHTINYNQDGGNENPELLVKVGSTGRTDLIRKTLIKFNLTESGLSGDDVTDAKLRVHVADVQKNKADPVTVTVSELTDDTAWDEHDVTWETAPASGGAISSVVGITGSDIGTEKDWDVTEYVKTELDGDQIISFALEDLDVVNNTVTFSSKAGVYAPRLIINNDLTLSTSNFDVQNNVVSLYPNPAQESFVIQTPDTEISNVKVFSINGSMIFNSENVNSNSLTVDTSAFQTGVYFVHVKNVLGALSVEKMIKK